MAAPRFGWNVGFRADIERVFRAFTEPAEVVLWWGPMNVERRLPRLIFGWAASVRRCRLHGIHDGLTMPPARDVLTTRRSS